MQWLEEGSRGQRSGGRSRKGGVLLREGKGGRRMGGIGGFGRGACSGCITCTNATTLSWR